MKVTGVRTRVYEHALSRRMGDANSPGGRDRGSGMAVFVDTDAGITGVVPAWPRSRGSIERLARLVIGEDPRGVVGVWKRLVDFVFEGGNEGEDNAAIGAIDVALWDLEAKANGEPLWRTLGAREGRAKAYASGMDMPLSGF